MPGRWSPGCNCCDQATFCSCNLCADTDGETSGINNAPCCIKLEISGIADATDGVEEDWKCCGCSGLNGTFYLLKTSYTSGCLWRSKACTTASSEQPVCGLDLWELDVYQSGSNYIVRLQGKTTTTAYHDTTSTLSGGVAVVFEKNYGTSKPDCDTWANETLTFSDETDYVALDSTIFGDPWFDMCDFTGATVKITALNGFTGCASSAHSNCGTCDENPSAITLTFGSVAVDDPCEEGETTCCDDCATFFNGKTFTLPVGTAFVFGGCCFELPPAAGSAGRKKFIDGTSALCATTCTSASDDMCLNYMKVCLSTPFFGTNLEVKITLGRSNEFGGITTFVEWTKNWCSPCADPLDCTTLSVSMTSANLTDYGNAKDYCDWSSATVSVGAVDGVQCKTLVYECQACLCAGTQVSDTTPEDIQVTIPSGVLGSPYNTNCCDDPLGVTCPDSSTPDANAIACCTAAEGTFCLTRTEGSTGCVWTYDFDPDTECPNHTEGSSFCAGWDSLTLTIFNGSNGFGKPNKFIWRLVLQSFSHVIRWETEFDKIGAPVPSTPSPGRAQVHDCLAPGGSATFNMGEDAITSTGTPISPCAWDGTTKISITVNGC